VVVIRNTRNANGVLVGEPEGKRPLGTPWHKPAWENNIKVDLKKVL
jgi:hypothetical protein